MSAPHPAPPPIKWSNEARTLASLLLFAHLFVVVVAVTAFTQPSFLQQRLHDVFAPYLRNLNLTVFPVSYPYARFHLTHAMPTDVDFSCEITYATGAGEETASIPPADLPWFRQRRYQLLANATGTLTDEEFGEDSASILPRAIGGSILKRHGASQGSIRVRAHYLPEIEAMARVDAGDLAPLANFRTVYDAQLFVNRGRVDILRRSETLEIAPAGTPPPASAPPSSPAPQASP